ncbi:MAG: FAD-dependent oxidoreductase, partial [Longimicrobiales bacterium]
MGGDAVKLEGPDFSTGIALTDLIEGAPLLGHHEGEPVLVVRLGDEVSAIGAACTHYGGPLAEGLVVGETVRCPWHHACFSLRTGEALAAPALNPLPRWRVEIRDGRAYLGERVSDDPLSARGRSAQGPAPVVLIGAGAAGSAAAEMLRREGYDGRIVLVDPDQDAPYDRPNLSKDYLAGSAPEDWIPLRPPTFYDEHGIERRVARAESIDAERAVVRTSAGETLEYGALLIATGAVPRVLDMPGADLAHVHTLRSLADSRRIIEGATGARSAVVIGASFIGMEVAASLRARGLDVSVVAPDAVPFERALGPELGGVLRDAHARNGVALRLGRTVARIGPDAVALDDGAEIPAQLVVVGVGVRVDTGLAERAGLAVDDGILVDAFLRTSDARIYAAGDVARWPDARTGRPTRIEHWVVAQRQGQAAARNILGRAEPFRDVPFFWTVQFDVPVAYTGHATEWDRVEIEGDPAAGDAAFRYVADGRT